MENEASDEKDQRGSVRLGGGGFLSESKLHDIHLNSGGEETQEDPVG